MTSSFQRHAMMEWRILDFQDVWSNTAVRTSIMSYLLVCSIYKSRHRYVRRQRCVYSIKLPPGSAGYRMDKVDASKHTTSVVCRMTQPYSSIYYHRWFRHFSVSKLRRRHSLAHRKWMFRLRVTSSHGLTVSSASGVLLINTCWCVKRRCTVSFVAFHLLL